MTGYEELCSRACLHRGELSWFSEISSGDPRSAIIVYSTKVFYFRKYLRTKVLSRVRKYNVVHVHVVQLTMYESTFVLSYFRTKIDRIYFRKYDRINIISGNRILPEVRVLSKVQRTFVLPYNAVLHVQRVVTVTSVLPYV